MNATPVSDRVSADEHEIAIGLRYSDEERPFGVYNTAIFEPHLLSVRYDAYTLIRARLRWEEAIRSSYSPIQAELLLGRSLVMQRLRAAAANNMDHWLAKELDWLTRILREQLRNGPKSIQ